MMNNNSRNVKIIGAGSIGNHLAHAARTLNWNVTLCDIDPAALKRTKNEIYPARYKKWDSKIKLSLLKDSQKGGFDIIFIGTPPEHHIPLALESIKEEPRAICIEKPLTTPDLKKINQLRQKIEEKKIKCFIGYDHLVGDACAYASLKVKKQTKRIEYIDVNIKEHWQGIFNAHPWLDGPKDSYLGYFAKGGGACLEHSHGISLWQHFASISGCGRVSEVFADFEFYNKNDLNYDKFAFLNVKTELGLRGRIVQDVVSYPPTKNVCIQYNQHSINWHCNYDKNSDAVLVKNTSGVILKKFKKKRPDDFIRELTHINNVIKKDLDSPINLNHGIETMMIVAAAYKSFKKKKKVKINYENGYKLSSII